MRWFTTFLLLLLVAAAIAWFAAGESLVPQWAGTNPPAADPVHEALAGLTADKVQTVELRVPVAAPGAGPKAETLSLTRGPAGWQQPGRWAVRQVEATALVDALTSLASRQQPEPLEPAGPAKFGLAPDQNPVVIKMGTGDRTVTLTVGKPSDATLDTPTYVRVGDQATVSRLGSGVLAKLAVPPERYRRRQLFVDAESFRLDGADEPVALPGNGVSAVRVQGPDGSFTVKRVGPTPAKADALVTAAKLATVWELAEVTDTLKATYPLRDRLDPAKLRGLLTALPELWVERFLPTTAVTETGVPGKRDVRAAFGGAVGSVLLAATDTGLDKPERVVSVTDAAGPTTLKIGKPSRTIVKPGPPPPPAQQFAPPPPPPAPIIETYHYAAVDGLDLLFEVKADKFNDLFPKFDDLRDANLARFEADDVTKVEVALKGQPPIALTKKKGNKNAEKDDEKQDRWYVGDILAESSKVTELVDQLSKLEAKNAPAPMDPLIVAKPAADRAVIDNLDAKALADLGIDGTNSITLTVQEKAPDGQTPPPPQTIKYVLGKDDAAKKKMNVQVAGWNRVNVVGDDVKKLIDRPALAYRGRRLFDTAEAKLTGVTVTKGADTFALANPDAKKWKLTKPLTIDADEAKAGQLTGDLSRLEVTEYVDDNPKPEDLEKKYGLKAPAMTIGLTLGGKEEKLDIGTSPEFKPEYYARRNGTGSVFTVPKTTIDSLKDGALAFLPLQLWSVPADKVTALEVSRADGKETYKLTQDGANWKITGPFDAPAPFLATQPLLGAVAMVRAEKYDAAAADPAKHGLDKPALKLVVSYKEPKGDDPKAEQAVTRTLLLGKPAAEPNTRFAKLADGPNTAVFVLNDTLLKDVDKPALDLLDKSVLVTDPATLTKVQIVGPKADENVTLTKDDKGAWKADGATFTPDAPTVNALAAFAARPTVQKIAAYGPAVKWADFGLDKPEYTITATFADKGAGQPVVHTIKLGKLDGTTRFARVDDGPAAAVLAPIAAQSLARGKLDFADRTLLSFDPSALTVFTRKKGADELEIVQGATVGWDIVKPAKLKADQAILDDLGDQLARLRATKVAAYGTKDLKPFGLDAPAATITLKVGLDKPTDKVLKIGKPVDDKQPAGDRYAMVDGKPDVTVGVLPAALANRLLGEPLKFRDRALAKFQKVDRIEMTRGDRTVTFADVSGTWKVVKPLEAEAEQADIDEFINALAKLTAEELEADKPKDLKPYGLDKPTVKWTLKNGDKEELTLLVGAKKDGRAFVKLEKGDLVGLLDPSLTAKVTGEYRKRAVWTGLDASQVENVEIKAGDTTFALTKTGMTWVDPVKPGDSIDAAKVSELLDALAGLKAQRYAADKDADLKLYGLQPPQRTIAVSQRGGGTKTVQIGREEGGSDGKRLYARVEEKGRTDVFVLSEADTQKLTRDRAAFVGKK